MATVPVNIRLDTSRDADLIQWLDALVKEGRSKSDFVRDAMRVAMMDSGTITDVLCEVRGLRDAIGRIDARLASGAVVVGAGGDLPQADDDDGAFDLALDAIGA